MRYNLRNSVLIRSENAAKSHLQKSAHLVGYLEKLPKVEISLDYGCGKLRYLQEIMAISDHVVVVDSAVQLERIQRLPGHKYCSIYDLAVLSNQWSVCTIKDISMHYGRYDAIFCLNVLQVVPLRKIRQSILRRLFNALKHEGSCYICVQYRNSDFKRMIGLDYAKLYGDGMLLDSLRRHSFYGFISPNDLVELVSDSGFTVVDLELNQGSCYLTARKLTHTVGR